MNRVLIIMLIFNSLLFGYKNLFIIKDKNGHIIRGKQIKHKNNRFYGDLKNREKRLLSKVKKKRYKKSYHFNKNIIVKSAKKFLGGRYVWGGTTPKGFDCSGYVKYIYEKVGIKLPRTAYAQSKVGEYVPRDRLQKGDLLFFLTNKKRNIPITHVGLYIGNDKFIHAASRRDGIIISSLSKSKYNRLFIKAKRVIK